MKKKIAVIDYGVGNIRSVENAISWLGYDVKLTREEKHLREADLLILPGVGAFEKGLTGLKKYTLVPILTDLVINNKKPILGICLGMQLLADTSEENGLHKGLGWIPGDVKKLDFSERYPVPHVGWNNINIKFEGPLFSRTPENPHFYFDHSFHFVCKSSENVLATCKYGNEIIVAVNKENIWGVQFHPEKSQNNGLKLLRGIVESLQVVRC